MPFGPLQDIAALCPENVPLLGVDLGTKTIGLAISNADQTIALPLETISRAKFAKDIEALGRIVQEWEAGGFVFGWPLNMDGTPGPSCERVRSFIDEMRNYPHLLGTDTWTGLWDERLSTASVEDFLVNTVDMSRTRREQVVDKLAAQHILQGALDALTRLRRVNRNA